MKMYDVSAPIFNGMAVYKNKEEKQPEINTTTNGHVTESRLSLDVHTGTHVDAPLHMMNDGATFESINQEDLVGKAKVIDVTDVKGAISDKDIESEDIQEGDFILFKSQNSFEEEFNFDFVFVGEDAARYLAERNIRGVGVDGLGIERSQPEHPTHRSLFEKDVIIMEGLRLKDVAAGEYFMVAAPLKLQGTDASPARVLLFEGLKEA
ncbi:MULTISPECIES: cyclase family protein [unclassified Bacillus (in: firmicutes)]|jgi:arylformamidase|uniref:cyclase family protein n=1 Tax=unclassified Bacillus (in: firmicutes) TaxID=185979 RepID=UPI001315EDC5|nr:MULTISPECIES: cyclase family protein [unclassified Bacillus (in: firmicutes)]MCA0172436.1 cyclase family protein [Bacillus sp. RAR_GA_16]QHA91441.1 cyclase family protein [Bacillus sp. N1-1]